MNTQEIILVAAAKAFSQMGYHKATMDKIAEAANLSKGALYYFYKNKDDLFHAVVAEGISLLEKKNNELINSDKDVSEIIYLIIKGYIDICFENPQLASIILSENMRTLGKDLLEKIEILKKRITEQITFVLKEGQRMGVIKPIDSEMTSIVFVGMLTSICTSWLNNDIQRNSKEVADTIYQLISKGIYIGA